MCSCAFVKAELRNDVGVLIAADDDFDDEDAYDPAKSSVRLPLP
jgi:hypothetical protein